MSETGDPDALAAEYALGTLDGPERAQAQAMLGVDQGFAAKVRLWERRLGELHLMVEPVEPDGEIWHRIKSKMLEIQSSLEVPAPAAEAEAAKESPPVPAAPASPAPETKAAVSEPTSSSAPLTAAPVTPVPSPPVAPVTLPPAPVLAPPAPAPLTPSLPSPAASEPESPTPQPDARIPMAEPTDDGRVTRRRLRRWRAFAALLLLLLLAISALVAAWRYVPERVPPRLQAVELLRLVGIKVGAPPAPTRPPAPPESQYDE